jgi:hypothetical protein
MLRRDMGQLQEVDQSSKEELKDVAGRIWPGEEER